MTSINFKKDYGYPAAAPLFLVWSEDGQGKAQNYRSRVEAEDAAAELAVCHPGQDFYVLGAVAVVSTSREIVGERFNPDRPQPDPVAHEEPPSAPEFAEVDDPQLSQEPL